MLQGFFDRDGHSHSTAARLANAAGASQHLPFTAVAGHGRKVVTSSRQRDHERFTIDRGAEHRAIEDPFDGHVAGAFADEADHAAVHQVRRKQ